MKKVLLLTLLTFALLFVPSCGGSDSKAVKEIPSGFIHLPKGGKMDNGLHYVSWESQISFLDDAGNCIYQTGIDNSDFIVKHEDEYYVNEEKISELLDIVNSHKK